MKDIKAILDQEVFNRNKNDELSYSKPDPLFIAKRHKDEYAILLCALFAYGNAGQIVKLLDSFDFELLNSSEDKIKKALEKHYYRFQNAQDIVAIFTSFRRLKMQCSLNEVFVSVYRKEENVLEGIDALIHTILNIYEHRSTGYKFLLSSPFKRDKNGIIREIGNPAYKRWNMFLRWMVRSDKLDLGLWKGVSTKNLILPLDTHTFKVSQKLGLLTRNTYDLKSALLITQKLKEFDANDPIKYDFALYRLGQEKTVF
ncbi:MAG: TIGR02757 family protein [Arcobacteraceae bacterium]